MCSRSSIYKTVAEVIGDMKGTAKVAGITKFDTLTVDEVMDTVAVALAHALVQNDEKCNAKSFKARYDAATTKAATPAEVAQIEAVNA
jgi:hypothetical protein